MGEVLSLLAVEGTTSFTTGSAAESETCSSSPPVADLPGELNGG